MWHTAVHLAGYVKTNYKAKSSTAQKMNFSIKEFLMENLNGKLYFLCSVGLNHLWFHRLKHSFQDYIKSYQQLGNC